MQVKRSGVAQVFVVDRKLGGDGLTSVDIGLPVDRASNAFVEAQYPGFKVQLGKSGYLQADGKPGPKASAELFATAAEAERAKNKQDVSPQSGFDITDKMREQVSEGVPLFKRTIGPRTPVGSAEAMDRTLREKFGDGLIQGLIDQGILKFEAEGSRPTQGATFDQGLKSGNAPAATLFYKTLTAEELPGVLMHELGEHFGIVRLLGQERYGVMLNELKALRRTDEVQEAWDKVLRNYTKRDPRIVEGGTVFMREVAAHLVEEHPDLPFVRRIINEIRAYFYEHFGTTMGNRVDANLVRGLAAAALRKASTGDLPQMKTPVRAFVPPPRPTTNPSAPRRLVQ